ncbi:hypothetical protein [Lactiplantibacillus daowaiensis]|uniref:Extracellular protein n=1 Tax=Lactiplantibacillus daowaiensis TaxID=2559918 RepID=A0ABW1RZV3_9LACO|nr:hypothetical protein [Lactiplantibacillus daowaiensis]
MKKFTTIVVTMGITLMVGGTVLPAAATDSNVRITASAATKQSKIQRGPIWSNYNKHDYKVANTRGKTYEMTGKANNIKLKVNHNLKNYKNSTWVRRKLTQIKQNGNWNVYYYVTTGKKSKIGGWVKLTDMKLKHPHKPAKHVAPDFDIWYRKLNQKQRNEYRDFTYSGARDADGEPSEMSF